MATTESRCSTNPARAHPRHAIECKSGATLASEWLTATEAAAMMVTEAGESARVEPLVVYGGDVGREGTRRAVGWRSLGDEPSNEEWLRPAPSLG